MPSFEPMRLETTDPLLLLETTVIGKPSVDIVNDEHIGILRSYSWFIGPNINIYTSLCHIVSTVPTYGHYTYVYICYMSTKGIEMYYLAQKYNIICFNGNVTVKKTYYHAFNVSFVLTAR